MMNKLMKESEKVVKMLMKNRIVMILVVFIFFFSVIGLLNFIQKKTVENFYNQQRERFVQHLDKVKNTDNFMNKNVQEDEAPTQPQQARKQMMGEKFTNNLPEFKEKFLNKQQKGKKK